MQRNRSRKCDFTLYRPLQNLVRMSLASSIAIRYLKHGIGPNISCPTDSFVIQTAVDALGIGTGEGGGRGRWRGRVALLRMSGVTKYKRPSEMWGKRSKDATVYFVPTDSALFFDSERLRPIAVITRQGEAGAHEAKGCNLQRVPLH